MRERDISQGAAARAILRAGPFTYSIVSDFPAVHSVLDSLYGGSRIGGSLEFADFHVTLNARRNRLTPWRKEGSFRLDGQPLFDRFPASMAMAYLEWGMNQCVARTAHPYLIVHAAVVEKNGAATILAGPTGAGKSTLCAALVASGWRLFSDELALIDTATGMLVPLGRPISLKNESIELIRRLEPGLRLGPLCEGVRKGRMQHMALPPGDARLATSPALPGRLVFVLYEPGRAVDCKPVEKGACLMRAIGQCFNYTRLGVTGFRTLADVVERCACTEVVYSDIRAATAFLNTAEVSQSGRGS